MTSLCSCWFQICSHNTWVRTAPLQTLLVSCQRRGAYLWDMLAFTAQFQWNIPCCIIWIDTSPMHCFLMHDFRWYIRNNSFPGIVVMHWHRLPGEWWSHHPWRCGTEGCGQRAWQGWADGWTRWSQCSYPTSMILWFFPWKCFGLSRSSDFRAYIYIYI